MPPPNNAFLTTGEFPPDGFTYNDWGPLLDEWELEAIHQPGRWLPKHVLALIRELKATRAMFEAASVGDIE